MPEPREPQPDCECSPVLGPHPRRPGCPPLDIGYRPVPIAPDPERDKRVAARRAADAARAGVALDRLLAWRGPAAVYDKGFADGYAASELHHNGHYGVPDSEADQGCSCPPALCYRQEARNLDLTCRVDRSGGGL